MLYFCHFIPPYFFRLNSCELFLSSAGPLWICLLLRMESPIVQDPHVEACFLVDQSHAIEVVLSEYSKPYVLFSATDAASAAIDFSRKSMDDGVVDSPPSRGAWRSPVLSASPLEGSQRIEGRHRSPSPRPPSSRTPHRQLYKCVVDNVSVNASMHSHIQCYSAPGRVCVHAIHPRCATVNHLRVEDDQFAASGAAVVLVHSVSELKGVGGEGEHPCLEDIVYVLSSVAPDLECALEARVPCPGHSHELVRP